MIPTGHDSLNTRSTLEAGGKTYAYYSLEKASHALGDLSRLPFSMMSSRICFRCETGSRHCDDLQAMPMLKSGGSPAIQSAGPF